MKGKKAGFSLNPFKILIGLINMFITSPEEENNQNNENETSALTQERAKTVDEK
ncbi:MAG: hypothetical protein ACPHY8_02030 [Patescibacteria group bacterium]